MSTRDPKNRPPIGITPDGAVYDQIEEICEKEERKRAFVAYKLLLMGLAVYDKTKPLNEQLQRSGKKDDISVQARQVGREKPANKSGGRNR